MKWIGQNIWNSISRFRDHTYFEESITLSTGKSITMDEYTSGTLSITKIQDSGTSFNDNDTSLMTAAAIADKIEAYGYSTTAGDITGVTAGTNLSGGGASGSVTINLADASTSAKGAASFASANFAASSGAISIKSGGVDLTDEVTGVLPVANTAAKVTSIIAGDGIDVDSATGDVTVTAETASATNPGMVELATTGEADTGTDTARAITAAGLKSHIDARHHYQYISFLSNTTVPADGDWMTVSTNGISNHTWNVDLGSGNVTVDSSTVTIPLGSICSGIRIPYAGVLVGFSGIFRSVGNHQSAAGLMVGVPTWNDYATFDCTLRAYDAADYSAGPDSNYSLRPNKAEDLSRSHSLTAGDVIYPVVKSIASNSRVVQVSWTIVIKTPIV